MAVFNNQHKQIITGMEWLLRAYAVGLAIATVRPIMALSFAFFRLTPQLFLGTAFWIGFSLHTIVAEAWIQSKRKFK